ncbi:hypothetical protein [Pseudomonas haemolytica]|jgi:hypothetical protein|uniref:Uncharacterized protein n=1 Tax=Pseudomonas haemolytica TaxID=2600065 RepID=A0ABS1H075_9PSED|nr:hypothetical protein [Pseudomonas haemolytica]MBK3462646.1 hypothetical protein [Pseudomonas haemolytica]
MRHIKYTPDIIEKLVDIAIESTFTLPDERLINLFSIVNLGMFDQLQNRAKSISQIKKEAKAKAIFKKMYGLIQEDISAFKKLTIEDKTKEFTQSRILDVDPATYGKNEILMMHDRHSADMAYIYLTQPVRNKFREKYKELLIQLDELFI